MEINLQVSKNNNKLSLVKFVPSFPHAVGTRLQLPNTSLTVRVASREGISDVKVLLKPPDETHYKIDPEDFIYLTLKAGWMVDAEFTVRK